jgi:hypothetical protein
VIASMEQLRPGDFMFAPIGGVVPGFFPVGVGQALLRESFTIGRVRVRHVAMVITSGREMSRPMIVEAMPSGARARELTHREWQPDHAFCRPPYEAQGVDPVEVARHAAEMVARKIGYSFGSYVMLAAWRAGLSTPHLEARINRRDAPGLRQARNGRMVPVGYPREAICSVLADQAATMAGFRMMEDIPHQCVTPGALAARLLRMTGSVWGGAGWDSPAVGPLPVPPQ